LLVLDEVHKVRGWSDVVKALWDQDRAVGAPVRVVLLGSSSLLLAKGTTDSLAGRFFLHRCLHWSFGECLTAFGWDLSRWLFFGGYPGAAPLAGDGPAWRAYVVDSLVETVLARDVIALQTIAKPALLRHLFALAASFHAQIVSYTKMLGQLQDAGNTTTLAHYLRLLETAYLISGLPRYSGGHARSRGSSPKLVLWNNALASSLAMLDYRSALEDGALWGRLVENAVGAHLLNCLQSLPFEVSYWREGNAEVDFVVRAPRVLWAIEVKSGRPVKPAGLEQFCRRHRRARPLIVGSGGLPLEGFFARDPVRLLAG
jgi:predicted AAA+ superfamily ATPase